MTFVYSISRNTEREFATGRAQSQFAIRTVGTIWSRTTKLRILVLSAPFEYVSGRSKRSLSIRSMITECFQGSFPRNHAIKDCIAGNLLLVGTTRDGKSSAQILHSTTSEILDSRQRRQGYLGQPQ